MKYLKEMFHFYGSETPVLVGGPCKRLGIKQVVVVVVAIGWPSFQVSFI
jgi:hypothetical protein